MKYFGIDGKQLERQYREHLSGFEDWEHIHHAEEYLIFPQNIGGDLLSIDETSLRW